MRAADCFRQDLSEPRCSDMAENINFHFDVDGENFSSAGEASIEVKKRLRQLGFSPDIIRRVSIAMYEGEINMVIHANGGIADVSVTPDEIIIVLEDHGPDIRQLGFGAGMGLPNMKKYTDRMDIDSKVGIGTKITMTVKI